MKFFSFIYSLCCPNSLTRLLALTVSASLFFCVTNPVGASFKPGDEYVIHSQPLKTDTTVNHTDINLHNEENKHTTLKTNGQILEQSPQKESFLFAINQKLQNFSNSFQQKKTGAFNALKASLTRAGIFSLRQLELHGVRVYYVAAVNTSKVMLVMFTPLTPFNTATFELLEIFIKAGIDLEVRLFFGYLALISSYITQTSWSETYTKKLNNFQEVSEWSVGPLVSDILIFGGVVTSIILITYGTTILSVAKSLILPVMAMMPSTKVIVTYFLKETKDAFIETEKECSDRKDECKSLFDKMTILFFNYLPDKMPDLGLDDVVINIKNGPKKP